jgi:hypothetical protein
MASWKFRQNGVRGNFVKMGLVKILSKWGFPNAPIKVLVEISSKLGFPKTCIEDLVEISWK